MMSYPLFTPRSGGGAGGGGSIYLYFIELANSPLRYEDENGRLYLYSQTLDQVVYAVFRVPSTYVSGNQLSLNILLVSAGTSGNMLIRSQSTLIRSEIDTISSTTNQHTSTNTAVSLSGATQNIPQKVSLDLSDGSGLINGVSISAGDLIKLRVYRDTDTSTIDVGFVYDAHEVTLG